MKKLKLSFTFLMIVIAGILLFSTGCDDEPVTPEGIFEMNFAPVVSGQDLVFGDVYQRPGGRNFLVEELRFFISDLTLVKEDGGEVLLSDVSIINFKTDLFNKTNHGTGVFKTWTVEAGNYKGVKFGLGVKADLNHIDPATQDENHPLGVVNGMNWNWQDGYRFLVVEGRIDSSASATGTTIDFPIVHHTGTDGLYRTKEYLDADHAFAVEEGMELQFGNRRIYALKYSNVII